MIVQATDFEGFYNISQNCYDQRDLELYIQDFEEEYLCKLLGPALSDALTIELEDNGGVLPPASRFEPLFAKMCLGCADNTCCCKSKTADVGYSIGLKKVLLGFIYYDYVIQQHHQNSQTGFVNNQNEASTPVSNLNVTRLAEQRYNRSVDSAKAIQDYINKNISTYPEFQGYCHFEPKFYPLL